MHTFYISALLYPKLLFIYIYFIHDLILLKIILQFRTAIHLLFEVLYIFISIDLLIDWYEPIGEYTIQPVMHGQCNTVTFLA